MKNLTKKMISINGHHRFSFTSSKSESNCVWVRMGPPSYVIIDSPAGASHNISNVSTPEQLRKTINPLIRRAMLGRDEWAASFSSQRIHSYDICFYTRRRISRRLHKTLSTLWVPLSFKYLHQWRFPLLALSSGEPKGAACVILNSSKCSPASNK